MTDGDAEARLDRALVLRARLGADQQAFSQLVRRHQGMVRAQLRRLVRDDDALADDLAQETFVLAWRKLDQFRGDARFSTWLYRIAYNVWYDYTRSHKETQDIDTPAVSGKNAQGANAGLKMDLLKALQILSENERTCITLQLMDGLSIDKIAEVTGMAQGTIKSHLSRGKQKLASYLKQNGYDR